MAKRRFKRSGGFGDYLFLRAGLELVAPVSLRTASTIAEADWAMPEGVEVGDEQRYPDGLMLRLAEHAGPLAVPGGPRWQPGETRRAAGKLATALLGNPDFSIADPSELEEDLDTLFEYHPLRLAVDRVSLGELRLAGRITGRKLESFEVPAAALKWAEGELAKLTDLPVVAVVDRSFGEHRGLPREWVGEVCETLRMRGFYPLVLGAKTNLTKAEADTRFAGKTTLTEAAALLASSKALLCCDTGLSALAGWLGVPQVCIFQSQHPWLRLWRLPGEFTGFDCTGRGLPATYGGDLPHGPMPPAEEAARALLALLARKSLGKYWRAGLGYFEHAVRLDADCPAAGLDVTSEVAAFYATRTDGKPAKRDLHKAIAALEEQQVAVASSGAVTVARTEDLAQADWLLDGPVRPFTERPRTLLCDVRLNALRAAALAARQVEGSVAEVGVYEGGVTRMLALMLPDRAVYGFDTFYGIPGQMRHTLDHHVAGEFAASFEGVSEYLADCPNVQLRQGLFPETAEAMKKSETFALVHLDGDLYETTRAGLEFFWPRLAEGGAIYLDDYRWKNTAGVTQAVDEFLRKHPEAKLTLTAPIQAALWRRTDARNR